MSKSWQPKNIKLDQEGIEKVLGHLEAQVMDVVWKKGCITVRDACDELCKKRDFSFNTIMTIMNRLTKKGILKKKSFEGVYCYEAKMTKNIFIKNISFDVYKQLLKDSDTFGIASLVQAIREMPRSEVNNLVKLLKN